MQGRGGADLLAVAVIIGAAQAAGGAACCCMRQGRWGAGGAVCWRGDLVQVVQVVQGGGIIGAARGAGLLLIRQGCGGAVLPFAGGVRFSTLPGSALGVGLELSEL